MAAQVWSKGFSKQSDNDGLVHIKIVDEYLAAAKLTPEQRKKVGDRFMSEPAYRAVKKWGDGKVPAEIVQEKAYRNLSQRNWVIAGQGFSYTAMGFKVTPGNPTIDFNSPPEAQKKAANVWERSEIFEETHLLGPAYCTDWNPATGTPEWWLAFIKAKVEAILNPSKQPEVGFK